MSVLSQVVYISVTESDQHTAMINQSANLLEIKSASLIPRLSHLLHEKSWIYSDRKTIDSHTISKN